MIKYLLVVLLFGTIFLKGCTVPIGIDDHDEVRDSVSIQQFTGAYSFKVNKYQASILKVPNGSIILLKIAADDLKQTGRYWKGNYFITVKQLEPLSDTNTFKGRWTFSSLKEANGQFSNEIDLDRLGEGKVGVSFSLRKDYDGNLYIYGYDQTEEGSLRFEFKKL